MGSRIFRVSRKKKEEIRNYYKLYGCTDDEAEYYSGRIFDYDLMEDDRVPFSDAWEIDCQSSVSAPVQIAASSLPRYGSWIKGGWSRSGYWDKFPAQKNRGENCEKKSVSLKQWYVGDGNSFSYWKYMKKNNREIDYQLINIQDFIFESETERESQVYIKKLPLSVSACENDKYLHLMIQTEEKNNYEKKPVNHVFMADVSGSMGCRLILMQMSMVALFNSLNEDDTVTIITYSEHCKLIDKYIPASDKNRFQKAVSSIKITGGYGKSIPVLQTAYALLNQNNSQGILTLFTDEIPSSNFRSDKLRNAFVYQQFLFGKKLNVFVFGSDTWADVRFNDFVHAGRGRLRAVIEPENLQKVLQERWGHVGDFVYDFTVMIDKENELSGHDPLRKYKQNYMELTNGSCLELTYRKASPDRLDKISISMTWKSKCKEEDREVCDVSVKKMPYSFQKQIESAENLLSGND